MKIKRIKPEPLQTCDRIVVGGKKASLLAQFPTPYVRMWVKKVYKNGNIVASSGYAFHTFGPDWNSSIQGIGDDIHIVSNQDMVNEKVEELERRIAEVHLTLHPIRGLDFTKIMNLSDDEWYIFVSLTSKLIGKS